MARVIPEWDTNRIYNVLRFSLPLAAEMVRLRWFYRKRPDADATEVFDNDRIGALRSHSAAGAISDRLTAREAVRVMCSLCGHDPDVAEPDWGVFAMGYLGI